MSEENPIEELKRADHLIYVSLKYTRTTDVMISIIKRLINAYNLSIKELLEYAKNNKIIDKIPVSVDEKAKAAQKILGKQSLKYFKIYNLLKLVNKSEYSAKLEFRKHVTMTVKTKKPIEIKTDTLHDYFNTTKEFIYIVEDYTKK